MQCEPNARKSDAFKNSAAPAEVNGRTVLPSRIKELGRIARTIAETGNMPEASEAYALCEAADILNALPCSSNGGGSDATGLSPQYVYDGSSLDLDRFFAHGSYCTAHNNADHVDDNKRVSASQCVYLAQAYHLGAEGHVLWDYTNRRRLIVLSLTYNEWNYFPLHPNRQKHIINMLTFAAAEIENVRGEVGASAPAGGPTWSMYSSMTRLKLQRRTRPNALGINS